MSRLLLDSHIVIAVAERRLPQLPRDMQIAVSDSNSEVSVSTASLWELQIKYRLGKLAVDVQPDLIPKFLAGADVTLLPIMPEHVFALVHPSPLTRDPFDNLLLGVCAAENMRLVTLDRALADHPLAWRPIP